MVAITLPKPAPSEPAVGGLSSPNVYSYLHVNGAFRQGGGITTVTATSTQSAYTLTFDDMNEESIIEIADVASPALSLTLPTATSTWETLLPNDGDMRSWIIDNQHAAATTTTVLAPSNNIIDLYAYTTNDDVIDGLEMSILTCWNKASDLVFPWGCVTTETLKAD